MINEAGDETANRRVSLGNHFYLKQLASPARLLSRAHSPAPVGCGASTTASDTAPHSEAHPDEHPSTGTVRCVVVEDFIPVFHT